MTNKPDEIIFRALNNFNIELPSWGFANTGTRFGKFIQLAAAVTVEDKFSDAGQVHALTGVVPHSGSACAVGPADGLKDVARVKRLARKTWGPAGLNQPNVFQDQEYKYGSVGNPDPAIRKRATDHILECVAIADALTVATFLPGLRMDRIIPERRACGTESDGLRKRSRSSSSLNPKQRLLIEYKPFEPAFYHTDIADWGMAFCWRVLPARKPGAGGHRPSLSGAEHRANCRVAAASWDDWRISFQRSPLCR